MEHFQTESFFQFQPLGSALRFADEINDITNHKPLFAGLSSQEVKAMCSFMTCYAAERGSVLMHEGEPGDALLVVLTGSVDVVKRTPEGEKVRVATVGPGQTLGEMSLIDGHSRFASCIADEPVDFALLTRAALNEILMMHPRLGNKVLLLLLSLFTERLRHSVDMAMPRVAAYAI
jgi:CRP-like cAMP-binding protein